MNPVPKPDRAPEDVPEFPRPYDPHRICLVCGQVGAHNGLACPKFLLIATMMGK